MPALLSFYVYDGDSFKIECPTGSGRVMNLFGVAKGISDRLAVAKLAGKLLEAGKSAVHSAPRARESLARVRRAPKNSEPVSA